MSPATNGTFYALVTPARNEGRFLGRTIDSVLAQTVLPKTWVIVDDGSTDATASLARECARAHQFIRVISVGRDRHRDFASKVHAFRIGVDALDLRTLSFLGNLDADVSLPSDYYSRLMGAFVAEQGLGMAGGAVWEPSSGRYRPRSVNRTTDVAGAAMLFRTPCYLEIGGYIPLACGGEDTAAQYAARKQGWTVRTVMELRVMHHRPPAGDLGGVWSNAVTNGRQDGVLGYSVPYFLAKVLRRMARWPDVLGGPGWLAGYARGRLEGMSIPFPRRLRLYVRGTQRKALFALLRGARR